MAAPVPNANAILKALSDLLKTGGMARSLSILNAADARFEETGYDNWDGGTKIYTLFLYIDPAEFVRLAVQREQIEAEITDQVKLIFWDGWISAVLRPRINERNNEGRPEAIITQVTRKKIVDFFMVSKIPWYGALGEVEFLERISGIPSFFLPCFQRSRFGRRVVLPPATGSWAS